MSGVAPVDRRLPFADVVAWAALLALALWLGWPALFPVHVEGFSASIVALGTHVANRTVGDFFPSQPFNTEYFALTKLGAVLGIAGLDRAFGLSGDAAMRVLMWGGLALCVAGSAVLVRRWSGASWAIVCAALLLMPGLLESGFFFNDNVPGAGLLIAALVLFRADGGVMRWLATGVLIGLGVAVRIDLVLVCAAIPLIALETQGWRRTVVATVIVGGAAIAVVFGVYAMIGATPFDALRVGAIAVDLWQRPGSLFYQFVLMIPFCSVPGAILLMLGVGVAMRDRRWWRVAIIVGIPVIVNLALIGKIWEVRQLLALSPFFGSLIALGIANLYAEFVSRRWVVPVAVAGVGAIILFAPPAVFFMRDGPREAVGRVGGIAIWRAWQQEVERDFATIDGVIGTAQPDRTIAILTDKWDEDRFLHLALMRRGFGIGVMPDVCAPIATVGQNGGRHIVQVTLEQMFVPYWQDIQADRLRLMARPCLAAVQPDRVFLLVRADRLTALLGGTIADVRHVTEPHLAGLDYSPIVAITLDDTKLAQLEAAYRQTADHGARHSVAEGAAATVNRTTVFR